MTWLGVFLALCINYALEKIFGYIGEILEARDSQFKDNVIEITGYAPLGERESLSKDSSRSSSTRRNLEEYGHTGFAYAEENNPNPALFEKTRTATIKRFTVDLKREEVEAVIQ